jgi:glucose-1-phosphate thymidylyltransferase
MYLGDNLLRNGVNSFIYTFRNKRPDAVVGIYPVKDPTRYGIVETKDGRVERMVEKPKEPKSNLALIGVYVFGPAIFDAVKNIKPSWRNELEITDAIQHLIEKGGKVEVQQVDGWWKDTGTVQDLLDANRLLLDDIQYRIDGSVEEESSIQGRVFIESEVVIKKGAKIRGPVIVGRRSSVHEGAYIGPFTSTGDNVQIKRGEIENSIIMDGCVIEANERIIDSLIGLIHQLYL